jgi:hypothetical protein
MLYWRLRYVFQTATLFHDVGCFSTTFPVQCCKLWTVVRTNRYRYISAETLLIIRFSYFNFIDCNRQRLWFTRSILNHEFNFLLHTLLLPFMWVNTHEQDVLRPIATFSAASFRVWASSLRLLLDDWQEEEDDLILGPVFRCRLPPVGISQQMAFGTLLRIRMCKYALFRTYLHTYWSLNGLLLFSAYVSTCKGWLYEYLVKCVDDQAFVMLNNSLCF